MAAVIRDEKFLISKRPFAIRLDSLRAHFHEIQRRAPVPDARAGYWDCRIDAVWFRRRRGQTVACIGELWSFQDEKPESAVAFLREHTDGRYGGSAEGRWDGASYWGNDTLDVQDAHLEILRPMLENYPEIPPGHDGWWRFETTAELRRLREERE